MSHTDLEALLDVVRGRNPDEPEFLQAVEDVAQDVVPFIIDQSAPDDLSLFERLTEPDRVISFRVCWEDDQQQVHINRGYRVQWSNAIGPYKGGIRFHPTVNLSVLKFLAFEQTFKNSLTGLNLGGAKGGSDFDPKGRSDREIMRFCQAFMTELQQYIGPSTDVPAGDIGVGEREIGYLFGQYKRLARFEGGLTGKALEYGGSHIRTEATGYGVVYLLEHALAHRDQSLDGQRCVVSGAGNVALHCAEKLLEQGAEVVTLSDSTGFIVDHDGVDSERLAWLADMKSTPGVSIECYAEEFGAEFHAGQTPWCVPCDLAFPCATQNEIGAQDARRLLDNGVQGVIEGANMPTTSGAISAFAKAGLLHLPSKAANAGGVAVSGLEMSQNSQGVRWDRDEVDTRLQRIMAHIHEQCVAHAGDSEGPVNYFRGANVAGFVRVARAIDAFGIV